MEQTPKHIKRALRELAAIAHEEELRRALVPLQGAFDRWDRGHLSSGALNELIHEFHQAPARELFNRYNSGVLEASVAYAIVTGLVDRSRIAPEVLSHLARAIAFYKSQEETVQPHRN